MSPWLGIVLVLGVLGASMAALSLAPWPPETRRKVLHVAMGLVCLSFPWVFSTAWPVLVVGGLAAAWLASGFFHGALGDRDHRGAIWFACGVALSFVLSNGDARAYWTAILVLTFADAAAALVGRHFGRTRKSLEGSAAFLAVAVFTTMLLQSPFTVVVVALGATLIEAALEDGLDNLFVPLGVLAVVKAL